MAGQGPAPADPATRRRRNEPTRGEWVDLPPLEKPVLPELAAGEDDPFPPETRAAWEAWRSDPVTAQYSAADIAYALDTIRLHAAMTPTSAAEVRLRMDALGLTPKGKRDLRWRVGEKSEAAAPKKGAAKARRRGHDRRARLSLVK